MKALIYCNNQQVLKYNDKMHFFCKTYWKNVVGLKLTFLLNAVVKHFREGGHLEQQLCGFKLGFDYRVLF